MSEGVQDPPSLAGVYASAICDDVDDDTPVSAIIANIETVFHFFPKVCIMQMP